MAEVANGVTGQNQSFNVLRNYRNYHHDGHYYLHVFYHDENLVVCHVGGVPCVAFDRFA